MNSGLVIRLSPLPLAELAKQWKACSLPHLAEPAVNGDGSLSHTSHPHAGVRTSPFLQVQMKTGEGGGRRWHDFALTLVFWTPEDTLVLHNGWS